MNTQLSKISVQMSDLPIVSTTFGPQVLLAKIPSTFADLLLCFSIVDPGSLSALNKNH